MSHLRWRLEEALVAVPHGAALRLVASDVRLVELLAQRVLDVGE